MNRLGELRILIKTACEKLNTAAKNDGISGVDSYAFKDWLFVINEYYTELNKLKSEIRAKNE